MEHSKRELQRTKILCKTSTIKNMNVELIIFMGMWSLAEPMESNLSLFSELK